MSESKKVDIGSIQRGPIRHESLPQDLLEQIASIHEVIGWILETTLEQFEINFMRDADPEAEVALWSIITAAWIDYHDRHLGGEDLPLEDEKLFLASLIVISTGVNDPAELSLPVDVGAKLLDCYNSLGNA